MVFLTDEFKCLFAYVDHDLQAHGHARKHIGRSMQDQLGLGSIGFRVYGFRVYGLGV